MAIGAVLGAAFEAFGPRLLRQGVKEGVESSLSRKAAGMVANRITKYTATSSGQRLVARAAGQRFATRLAEHEGTQRLAKYAIKKDVNQRVQGEGQYGPKQAQKVVNINAGTSTVPRSVNDPSTMNVANAYDPVVQQYAEQQRLARQQGGGRVRQRGSGPTGWAGTGKGWWEQNEQITQKAAFSPSSVTTLGDFSAARGPTRWAHSLGKGLGRNTVARGVGFVEGLRSVEAEEEAPNGRYGLKNPGGGTNVPGQAPAGGTAGTAGQTAPTVNFSTAPFSTGSGGVQDADVQEHHLTDVRQYGRGGAADLPSSTGGSNSGMGASGVGSPQPRLSTFYGGAGEIGTGPAAIGPAPAPTNPGRRRAGINPEALKRIRSGWASDAGM